MAILIKDPVDNSSVPYLRGILTRSLRAAGLDFKEAYKIADRVRADLPDDSVLTTTELAAHVVQTLELGGHAEAAERYGSAKTTASHIFVLDRDGQPQPFSKSRLAQGLELCALGQERSFAITQHIEQLLTRRNRGDIRSNDLVRMTYDHLLEVESKEVARRYMVWTEFERSGRPLMLLIGGTTGSGKSSIGAEIAHRLNIIRTQSSDMLREVMRLMMPERLLPTLHTSSFLAWKAVPASSSRNGGDPDSELERGYLLQSSHVSVAVEGVISRAETEQVSLILEGIHIHPQVQKQLLESTDAIIVPIILAVLKPKQLQKHLKGRGHQVSSRRAERYLDHFDAIWSLQSFLLSEADKYDISIITNVKVEDTISQVMDTIMQYLDREFEGDPAHVLR